MIPLDIHPASAGHLNLDHGSACTAIGYKVGRTYDGFMQSAIQSLRLVALASSIKVIPVGLVFSAVISIVISLGGCITAPAPVANIPTIIAEPAPGKPTTLSVEADNALKAAEQTVIETRIRRALWTAAAEHLERARAAAKKLDSDLTLKNAREVIALCQLSLQQKQSPPVTW